MWKYVRSVFLTVVPTTKEKRFLDIVMSVDGQITPREARKLMELAQQAPANTVIVEIGTYRGRSAIALGFGALLGAQNRVYAVDPHVDFVGIYGFRFGPRDQAALYRNLTRAGLGHIVSVVSLPSVVVARAWPERNIGVLFIDGDHRHEAVRTDFEAWSYHIVKGGVVAFHDSETEGVQKLLEELTQSGRISFLGRVDSLSWFRNEEIRNA